MRLFEEVCKAMHKRAVTKMQTTAGRVIKGSCLSQQNLFRFMASSPASFTCYATRQLCTSEATAVRNAWNQRPRSRLSRRQDLENVRRDVVIANGCCCRALTAVHSWRRFNSQWSLYVCSMTHRAHVLTSGQMTLQFVFSNSNVSFKQEGNGKMT